MCDRKAEWKIKTIAVSLIIYVSNLALNQLVSLGGGGWVGNVISNGPIANVSMLVLIPIRTLVNILTILITIGGTTALLYNTESPVDLVLNSLALAFLTELDDAVVTTAQHKATEILFHPRNIGERKYLDGCWGRSFA